jgi:predicted amidohydrolase/GNAT superfamily N-acetyltransferase
MGNHSKKAKLLIRNPLTTEVDEIKALSDIVYSDMPPYSPDALRGQINNFPEGQFVAVYEGKIIGYCASFRISGELALKPHTWAQITGGGFAATHELDGEYLYAMEVFVDPKFRGLRVGQRFYETRKRLCRHYRLRGIVFGGRLPGLRKRIGKVGSPEEYVKLVQQKKIRDLVLSFQLRQGFELLGIMKDYLPHDFDSMGYASHMIWRNPDLAVGETEKPDMANRTGDSIRLACIQYQQRRLANFDEFEQIITYFLDVVSDYKADFAVFPELFSLQLLSLEAEPRRPAEAIRGLTAHYPTIRDLFHRGAMRYNVNVVAGSHPVLDEQGVVRNTALICLRDGAIHEQAKVHPTPSERFWWNIEGGTSLSAIDTDCGPIGVLVCYDVEFPETARHLVNQGANILFVPFCTDERQSYLRVRYCAQARAVENQCFVAMAGNVGNLPRVTNMELQYAQSCILTPCDFAFSRDGIAADSTPNVETVLFADLRLESLLRARNQGTVQNLKDRRHDLYRVAWNTGRLE